MVCLLYTSTLRKGLVLDMEKIAGKLTDLIGNTPLLELRNYEKAEGLEARVVAKLEAVSYTHLGDNGTLKVATNAEFDPWEYRENGEFVGADMDIIRAVADKMGMKVEIQNMEFEAVLSALVSKSCDVAVACLLYTSIAGVLVHRRIRPAAGRPAAERYHPPQRRGARPHT